MVFVGEPFIVVPPLKNVSVTLTFDPMTLKSFSAVPLTWWLFLPSYWNLSTKYADTVSREIGVDGLTINESWRLFLSRKITFDLAMTLTCDLWPSETFQQWPLSWWSLVPSFIEIAALSRDLATRGIVLTAGWTTRNMLCNCRRRHKNLLSYYPTSYRAKLNNPRLSYRWFNKFFLPVFQGAPV